MLPISVDDSKCTMVSFCRSLAISLVSVWYTASLKIYSRFQVVVFSYSHSRFLVFSYFRSRILASSPLHYSLNSSYKRFLRLNVYIQNEFKYIWSQLFFSVLYCKKKKLFPSSSTCVFRLSIRLPWVLPRAAIVPSTSHSTVTPLQSQQHPYSQRFS